MTNLRNDVMDYFAVDVGQAEVAAGVAVGEFFVVEAEELEHGGVEVVDVDTVLDGLESEFVGGAVDVSAFNAASGEPGGEAVVVVIAAVDFSCVGAGSGKFDGGGASEFAATKDEGVFEHATLFEVGE